MEELRSSLEKVHTMDTKAVISRALPTRPVETSAKMVRNSVFLQRDRTPSPATSPTFGRKSPFAKEVMDSREGTPIATRESRSTSPFKSSLASPEPSSLKGTLSRSKSVTFNESLEVRHMSDCSFEEGSSPMSANYGNTEESFDVNDLSDMDDVDGTTWENSAKNRGILPYEDTLFEQARRRDLPSITGARPLPTVPLHNQSSPETRLQAMEREDSLKDIAGLGLHLSQATLEDSVHRDDNNKRSQSEKMSPAFRSTVERDTQLVQPEAFRDSLIESGSIGVKEGEQSRSVADQPVYASKLPLLRSPEPAISRQYVKEKLAQRKAAKEAARKEQEPALEPHNSLAPPLHHYDSFVTPGDHNTEEVAPESPLSEASDVAGPQRKVSDQIRSMTPIEQIVDDPQEPQSGRALHHERDKKLSLDLAQTVPVPSPRGGFTAICYEGDDYATSDDDFHDDVIIHNPVMSKMPPVGVHEVQDSALGGTSKEGCPIDAPIESIESPLQHLPEIPEVPKRDVDEHHPTTPLMTAFDMRPMSLCLDMGNFGSDSLGLEQYMTPEKHPETPITSRTVAPASPTKIGSSPSVLDAWVDTSEGSNKENDTTPEPATITARGMKLRTRPSLTPFDAAALAARRRQVSLEIEHPENSSPALSSPLEDATGESLEAAPNSSGVQDEDTDLVAHIQPMAMPVLQPLTRELSFSDINNAFDRVMQKQKKGYVIRQQARVVHASAHEESQAADDQTIDDGTKGHTRQSSSVYTTFSQTSGNSSNNSNMHRRQGSKIPIGVQMSPRPRAMTGESVNCMNFGALDGGRLFIRVMQVKNLTLPMPNGEEAFFTCTLDNGKHCVTTPKHTLAVNTKINQEFELIADHDLEFILTLQAQYTPPVMPARPKSTIGRLLNSPKKHKPTGSITSLTLASHVSENGSFARAHLALKHFRNKAFGRPYTMLVPILNEWATEVTGVPTKAGPQVRQRKPYKIGNIELQVLYVPPVESEHRHALPTSLSQAVKDVRDAEWHNVMHCEGYLSQQGGDCPYWRRRHFKLVGPKLIAYHANTGQVRATINLTKAIQVTDDKESLIAPEVTVGKGANKTRRKSGFAEREEGHLYVAEGFRLRFANGELIDFYADSLAEKERWMVVLRDVVQKIPVAKAWCQTVLEFEATRASTKA